MPSVKMPRPSTPAYAGTVEDRMRALEDSTIRLCKEIDFLLMNLDQENVPVLGEFMKDANGRFSQITQTVSSLDLKVGDVIGDIASINIDIDGIGLQVKDVEGDISRIDVDVDGIDLRVKNAEGDISQISTDANGIKLLVTDMQGDISSNGSLISQNKKEIGLSVKQGEIISSINLSPEEIKLSADRIELDGIARVSGDVYIGDPYESKSHRLNFAQMCAIRTFEWGSFGYGGIEVLGTAFKLYEGDFILGPNVDLWHFTDKIDGYGLNSNSRGDSLEIDDTVVATRDYAVRDYVEQDIRMMYFDDHIEVKIPGKGWKSINFD